MSQLLPCIFTVFEHDFTLILKNLYFFKHKKQNPVKQNIKQI
ncbi:hypothetical protein MmTuc01_3327 [Methanosarcina mazei Tuc01]|uniref:Uncharacterized protein n=1 Tax=Methanosarcina mazei Tuc01 TaxID=1236903 RepID=M1Q1Z1_METMZ|nr:hypothetical protein MmTuc01_3327 [Methanosarcina mazei Tuc01]